MTRTVVTRTVVILRYRRTLRNRRASRSQTFPSIPRDGCRLRTSVVPPTLRASVRFAIPHHDNSSYENSRHPEVSKDPEESKGEPIANVPLDTSGWLSAPH